MTEEIKSVPQPFPQTELKLLISKCVHCGEPLWDNGTVAVHLKLIIYEGKPTVLQTQWCDTTKKTIGETALISVPTESRQLDAQKVADRLIRKIVHAAFELAETRWDLEISEETNGMGNRVEMADDIIQCLNGEEIGCLDPDDEEDVAKIQQFLNECVSEIRAFAAAASSALLPVGRQK
jgi:hypothetical protein